MKGDQPNARPGQTRLGLSLIEVTISVVIVAVMMVAALTTVSGVMHARQVSQNRQVARTLAETLMAEIMSKEYQDPDTVGESFGQETGEAATGNRSLFDDVDDYDGWSANPPQWSDGVVVPNRQDWTRSVDVFCTSPADLNMELPNSWDFGLKRITVTVSYGGEEMVTLVAIRGSTKDYE